MPSVRFGRLIPKNLWYPRYIYILVSAGPGPNCIDNGTWVGLRKTNLCWVNNISPLKCRDNNKTSLIEGKIKNNMQLKGVPCNVAILLSFSLTIHRVICGLGAPRRN